MVSSISRAVYIIYGSIDRYTVVTVNSDFFIPLNFKQWYTASLSSLSANDKRKNPHLILLWHHLRLRERINLIYWRGFLVTDIRPMSNEYHYELTSRENRGTECVKSILEHQTKERS